MAADERECVDLWSVLEDAEATVERWPEWQREVSVNPQRDDEGPPAGRPGRQRWSP